MTHFLILAGGSGTRLWPASTRENPKQFLDSGNGESFLQRTILRALSLPYHGKICIVVHRDHRRKVEENLSIFDPAARARIETVSEPSARNTAPAVMLGVKKLLESGSETDTVFMMPSDHSIEPLERLRDDLGQAVRCASEGFFTMFGVPPVRPETGYGYIEAVESPGSVYKVRAFTEKPDPDRARVFLEEGNYYWNSGMLVFRIDMFLSEMSGHAPEIWGPFQSFSFRGPDYRQAALDALYDVLPSLSMDYAVLEKSANVVMVKASFSWSDVGSWDEYAELCRDIVTSPVFSPDAHGNFALSDLPVAFCGVEDIMVVVRNGSVLVCKKGYSQNVKSIIEAIKDSGRTELL